MGQMIDLRKYNIKTQEDAVEFLGLIVAKTPQLISFMKDQKMKNISLRNRLEFAQSQPEPSATEIVDTEASVVDRMTGKHRGPAKSAQQTRIEQMKAASAEPKDEPTKPDLPEFSDDAIPGAPVGPGEIGHLHVPHVDQTVPQDVPTPPLPDEPQAQTAPKMTPEQQAEIDAARVAEKTGGETYTPTIAQEDAEKAAGSKSEHATDDDIQPEDTETIDPAGETELTDDEKAALLAGPDSQTKKPEDTESVADKVARKTQGKSNSKKK